MLRRYQVIIVGGGPVGLALAVDLGQRGIRCALVERNLVPQRIPKGQNLTSRTLEHFYFWNCVDELRATRALPSGYPIGNLTAYGSLMSDYWFTGGNAIGQGENQDYYFQANDRLPQYYTEEVLRNRLAGLPDVDLFFGWTAETFEQFDGGTRVTIKQLDSSAPGDILEADYLVGCDGGRSLVRESLGIDRGGADFDERMVLAVFRSRELHDGLQRFPERTTYRVLRPELRGYWQFFGRIDVGEGWFFHAPVPKDTTPENYDFLGLIQGAAGFPFQATFDHVGFWDLRISIASTYRLGRIFIAGDACHTHPPYGGFGLNTGLEDVINLSWKLTASLEGWGGDALLDSYTPERRPIFERTGQAMIAGTIERDRDFLERYNPERNREEFEEAWEGLANHNAQQTYEPHYEGSPVVLGPPGGYCGIDGENTFRALAGHHLGPRSLSSGVNVFEELGTGFTLLAFDAADEEVAPFEEAARSLRIPLKVVRDTRDGQRLDYAARFVLVRPDQFVAWAGDATPPGLVGLWCRITGNA